MEENTAPVEESGIGEGEVTATDQEPAGEIQQTEQPEVVQEPAKTFTQDELDKIVEKRLAKERRKLERQQQPQQQRVAPVQLDPAQFESQEAYLEAVSDQKALQKMEKLEATKRHQQLVEAYREKEEEAIEKYADFEQVAYNPSTPISDVMAISIQASDQGPELAYYLGKNPKEAARIAKMPPLLQAREIGKLEATLAAEATKPQVSKAPEPIKPIGAKGQAKKAVEDMSDDEFAEYRRKIRAQRGR